MRRVAVARTGAWSYTAIDLSSLSLIGAMWRVAGARTGFWSRTAVDLRSLSLTGAMRPGGTRAEGGGRGEGVQVGRGGEVTKAIRHACIVLQVLILYYIIV